jgi:hypothetical protein
MVPRVVVSLEYATFLTQACAIDNALVEPSLLLNFQPESYSLLLTLDTN